MVGRTKSSGPVPPSKTLIVDNGAYTIKAGFSSPEETDECKIIPNCLARDRDRRVYIGSQLEKCKDFGDIAFRRPVEKGYIVNWEAQREIWDHEFFDPKSSLYCDPKDTGLILAEAPNSLPVLQQNCDQMVFEEFQFSRYYRCIGPRLNAYNNIQPGTHAPQANDAPPAEILLVIDSGYSHTTVTPVLQGRPIQSAIRRLDVGGKLLTNYLTRLLSLRHFDMRNESHLVNDIKEAACYISPNFSQDLEATWKGTTGERRESYVSGGGVAKDYVLPDYHKIAKGYVRDFDPTLSSKRFRNLVTGGDVAEDVITLRNERFTVPELLFSPMDIGLRQPGLAQVVMQSLSVLPVGLWPGFLSNILVVGGNAKIDGFIRRLYTDLRELAPAECIVRVVKPQDPLVSTWQGGSRLAKNEDLLRKLSVTKQEYEEYGSAWVAKRFGGKP